MQKRPEIEKKFLRTSFGNIAYLEAGDPEKPPVLFVHGIPTSSYLWRHVIGFIKSGFHCYAPDLMGLGDTEVDPHTGKFHMRAQCEMLFEFMEKLGHQEFSLVCHDQGGAAAELMAATQPERIKCWAVTDSVCYDNWPVPAIDRLQSLARTFPRLTDLFGRLGMFEFLQIHTRFFSDFRRGLYDKAKMSEQSIREYLRPLSGTPEQRARFLGFLLAGSPRYSMEAVEGIKKFEKPVMVIWAADDYYISPSWGVKLYRDIPGARTFELVPFCGHFWQEEKPSEFASSIMDFLEKHAGGKARKDAV